MSPGEVLRIAWCRKLWIAAPVALTAGLASLLAIAVESRVQFRARVRLAVTDGAQADAVFALRSPEVFEQAIEGSVLENRRVSAADLSVRVSVTVEGRIEGRDRLVLDVEAPSAGEAEWVASAVAGAAARKVTRFATKIADKDKKRLSDLKFRRNEAQASVSLVERELSKIKATHEFRLNSEGYLVTASLSRLRKLEASLDEHGLRLRELDAGVGSLRERLDHDRASPSATPNLPGREGLGAGDLPSPSLKASRSGTPLLTAAITGRLEAMDRELARLREELTDAHPRVAALLRERAALQRELAAEVARLRAVTGGPDRELLGLRRELARLEGDRARVSATVDALTQEWKKVSGRVKAEAAGAERHADLRIRLKRNRAELERAAVYLGRAEEAAGKNTAAHAALELLDKEPARPVGEGPSPAWAAGLGAAIGLVLGALLAALAEAVDPVIRSAEDVMRHLDVPVLATVSGPVRKRASGGLAVSAAVGAGLAPLDRASRRAGIALWLFAFLVAAATVMLVFYPGWERLKTMFSRGGDPPAGGEAAVALRLAQDAGTELVEGAGAVREGRP